MSLCSQASRAEHRGEQTQQSIEVAGRLECPTRRVHRAEEKTQQRAEAAAAWVQHGKRASLVTSSGRNWAEFNRREAGGRNFEEEETEDNDDEGILPYFDFDFGAEKDQSRCGCGDAIDGQPVGGGIELNCERMGPVSSASGALVTTACTSSSCNDCQMGMGVESSSSSGRRDVALPLKAVRTVAIAITSLVSFVPVWKLYLPGLWFSQVRPDLRWTAAAASVASAAAASNANSSLSSAASIVGSSSSGSIVVTAGGAAVRRVTYNEVNDHSLRRDLARKSAQAILKGLDHLNGMLHHPSERRTFEVVNSRGQTLFTQSWMPTSSNAITSIKGLVILLHGLNEHSGRYDSFACQLNEQGYGVYAMDWIGHGGSDGLHGYVESLDQVVLDTKLYLKQVTADHPGVPVFMFGHSTGGAIALKTSFVASEEKMFRGIVLTSPAVRVKPSHPIVAALAPLFSLLLPRYQFRGATKVGVRVSRDPLALIAKYSDPLVYTGPIRIRTGTEILRLGSFLQRNFERITVPFFVLHGSADKVTDPTGSQDLYDRASSAQKRIQIYEGLLHDLLFELEKDVVVRDIIRWLDSMLQHP